MRTHFKQRAFGATTQSVILFHELPGRKYLSIQNQDAAAVLYVRLGAPAETNATSVRILPGGFYELRDPCAGEEVNVVSTVDTSLVNVVEGV